MNLKKTILGVFIILLLVIIGVGGYIYYNAQKIADEIVRDQIIKNYNQSTDTDYLISLESLSLDILSGSISLSNIHITPKDSLVTFRRSIDGKAISNTFLDIHIDKISLISFDYISAFSDRKIDVKKLEIIHPKINIYHHKGIEIEKEVEQDTVDIRQIFLTHYDTFLLGQISVKDVSSTYYSITDEDTSDVFSLQNFNYKINNVIAHKQTLYTQPFIKYDDFSLHSKNIAIQIAEKSKIKIGTLDYESATQQFSVGNFKFDPIPTQKQFFKSQKHRKAWISFSAKQLQIDSLDIQTWLLHQEIRVSKLELTKPVLSIYADLYLSLDPNQKQKMLGTKLTNIDIPFYAEHAIIDNALINLDFLGTNSDKHGKLQINNLNVQASNLTNIKKEIEKNKTLKILAQTQINKTGKIKATINIDLASKTSKTSFNAICTDINLIKFNSVLSPLMLVDIKDGEMKSMKISSTISEEGGFGKMDAHYTNLKLLIKSKSEEKKNRFLFGTVSGIANGLIRNNNIPGDKYYRQGTFKFQKAGNDSFYKMLWLVTLYGLEDSILGSKGRDQREAKKAAKKQKN